MQEPITIQFKVTSRVFINVFIIGSDNELEKFTDSRFIGQLLHRGQNDEVINI